MMPPASQRHATRPFRELALAIILVMFCSLAVTQLPALRSNVAPIPESVGRDWPGWPGVWSGRWQDEPGALLGTSIDIRLRVNTQSEQPDHPHVVLSVAPHAKTGLPPSLTGGTATVGTQGEVLYVGPYGEVFEFRRDGEGARGHVQFPDGTVYNAVLSPIAAPARGEVHVAVGSLHLDEFGWLIARTVGRDALGQSLLYGLFCGLSCLVLYGLRRDSWLRFKVQLSWPTWSQLRRELIHASGTLLVFGVSGAVALWVIYSETSQHYFQIVDRGIAWWLLSIVLVFFLHDTWFYWTHRLLHHKWFARHHRHHHESSSPTPLTAYAFGPLEAVFQSGFVPLVLYLLPLHTSVIVIFYGGMILRNAIGHSGFEVFPPALVRSRWWSWLSTVTHHDLHHQKYHYNFGLYFTIWDRLMGTQDPFYEKNYEEVFGRRGTEHPMSQPP